jgi:hypothetical protein
MLAFVAVALLLAIWGTPSPAIRTAPSLGELIDSAGPIQASPSTAEA